MSFFRTSLDDNAGTRLSIIPPKALLARVIGILATGRSGWGVPTRRACGLGAWLVLGAIVVIATSGCSRRPDSHASAASSAGAKIIAKAAARGTSSRPVARVATFGIVTAADTAVPVSGCEVEAFSVGEPHVAVGPSALTNAAGMFALDFELRPGKYTFEVSKGKVMARVPVVIAPAVGWCSLLHIALPHAALAADTQSKANGKGGAAVFGQVTKPDGVTPFVGAAVLVGVPTSGGGPLRFITKSNMSNKSGLFAERKKLNPGKYWIMALAIRHRNINGADVFFHLTVAFSRLTVTTSSQRNIVLRLRASPGLVGGRVVDSKGRVVTRATVWLTGADRSNRFLLLSSSTDAKGYYALRYVPFGTYIGNLEWKNYTSPPCIIVVGKRPMRKDFQIRR